MNARIAALLILLLVAGCTSQREEELVAIPELEPQDVLFTGPDGITCFTMEKHSDLYKDPLPPAGMSEWAKAEYIRGHRMGWEDEADDYMVEIGKGRESLVFYHVPATAVDLHATAASRLGEAAGRRKAEEDFKTFCSMLEDRLNELNATPPGGGKE